MFVLLDKPSEHAKHFSCIFARTVEVGDLISRESERSGHDEAALRFLKLWHYAYFTGCHQCSAALSTNGERAELIDGEECLSFVKLGEDALDVVHFSRYSGSVDVNTFRALRQRHPADRVISRTTWAQTGVPLSRRTWVKSAIRHVVRLMPIAEGGS